MTSLAKRQKEQVSRRSFIGKSGLSLGAMAFAGNTMGQTRTPVSPASDKANLNGRFAGKVVLITGATSGIGEATAYAFAREGAKVFFCGRREHLGKQVEAKIKAFGGDATFMRADVRNESEIKSLVDAAVRKYGRLDIAFNNAGVESPGKTISEMTLEEWNNVITTNITGVFLSMKYEIPQMLKSGGGNIINVASVGGQCGFANIGPYGSSKAGVIQLSRIAAMEYTDKNIRVNSISPGAVDTPMLHRALASWGAKPETVAGDFPVKRLATAEEMARAVMFLASEEATIVVGTDFDVTGGYIAK
ncbi:MAG TPA: glucose 1-dehydrogenase [Pyrinomonadaceae bacterium]|nr:glucose 1-dehydrogenase [Pyrinomonadaceae bacterium]